MALTLARELRARLIGSQPHEANRAVDEVRPDEPALLPYLERVHDFTTSNLDQLSAILRDLLDHV